MGLFKLFSGGNDRRQNCCQGNSCICSPRIEEINQEFPAGRVTKLYGKATITTPNPNKYRFEIEKYQKINRIYVYLVQYPDCTTFDGYKVIVSDRYITNNDEEFDPHFLEDNGIIARFPGTEQGYQDGIKFAELIS